MDSRRIDLHTHSLCSDGSLTPTQLVEHAKESGLSAMALSDHDTTTGVKEAVEAGKRLGIEVIPAIELSCQSDTQIHMLGLMIDVDSAGMKDVLRQVLEVRHMRSEDNCRGLQKLGFDVSMEEANALAGGEITCRAHFAKLLVNKGYCSSVKEAFDLYLGVGKPAYSGRQCLSDKEAVEMIHGAGGIAILAHLNQMKMSDEDIWSYLRMMKDAGLDGIEGYYTEYSSEQFQTYNQMAEKLNFLISGGSDFHGAMKPHIAIGRGYGDLQIPYELLSKMKAYHTINHTK